MDALIRPLSRPSPGGVGAGGGGVDIASLLAGNGGAMSQQLMQLSLAGLIGGNSSQDHFGELHERMMRGTTIEEMRLEQDRRRTRGRSSSSRNKGPGEWMEDSSTNVAGGGGILSSLSGNDIAFGRRTDHHHFALLTSLRPSATESRRSNSVEGSGSTGVASAYLRPMMESMGMKYRPEVSSGLVVRDSVAQLTGVGSYWGSVFAERRFVYPAQLQVELEKLQWLRKENRQRHSSKVKHPHFRLQKLRIIHQFSLFLETPLAHTRGSIPFQQASWMHCILVQTKDTFLGTS